MAEKKKAVAVTATASDDKKKALETAIAKIEKDYGKGTIMRLGDDISVNVEALSTGSCPLTLPSASAAFLAAVSSRYTGLRPPVRLRLRCMSSPPRRKTAGTQRI